MALSPRQRKLYTDRVHIWRVSNPLDNQGTPQEQTFTLLYSNVPCKFEFTINVDDPTETGGQKRKTALTTDILHLPIVDDLGRTLRIPNGAYFVNVTPANPNRGTLEIGQGAPNLLPGSGSRANLNTQLVQVMTEEHPPAEVLVGV